MRVWTNRKNISRPSSHSAKEREMKQVSQSFLFQSRTRGLTPKECCLSHLRRGYDKNLIVFHQKNLIKTLLSTHKNSKGLLKSVPWTSPLAGPIYFNQLETGGKRQQQQHLGKKVSTDRRRRQRLVCGECSVSKSKSCLRIASTHTRRALLLFSPHA